METTQTGVERAGEVSTLFAIAEPWIFLCLTPGRSPLVCRLTVVPASLRNENDWDYYQRALALGPYRLRPSKYDNESNVRGYEPHGRSFR